MNWIKILLFAISWVLAVIVARKVVKNPGERRALYGTVMLVSLFVFFGIFRVFVSPSLDAWDARRTARSELLQLRAFQTLSQYAPETFEQILQQVGESVKRRGNFSEQVWSTAQPMIQLMNRQLPYTSDTAAVNFFRAALTMMTEIRTVSGGDQCHRFANPNESDLVRTQGVVSDSNREMYMNAIAEVIKYAAIDPQPAPLDEEIAEVWDPFISEFSEAWGEDIWMMAAPEDPEIDKDTYCAMVIDYYQKLLDLPVNQSGRILRWLLAPEEVAEPTDTTANDT